MDDLKKDFRIVRLTKEDAESLTDHIRVFKDLILSNEEMYPNIEKWFKNKVVPGLKSSERIAFIGYIDKIPIVSAVVKRGEDAKFCHLRIGKDFQNENLGNVFFSLMALEVRKDAKEIHFTLPEGLWEKKKGFFQSFGFEGAIPAGTQYRLFEQELRCSASFSRVWKAVLEKLPKIADIFSVGGYSLGNQLLFSIQPEYVQKIIDGEKKVEIRRKFAKKWEGYKVNLYSSRPMSSLVGEAIIEKIISGTPEDIWEKYNSSIGCTKEEYDKYTNSAEEIFAIIFNNIKPYKVTVPISQISFILDEDLRPPQSYYALKNNKSWANAVSIAALLHGRFSNVEAKLSLIGIR